MLWKLLLSALLVLSSLSCGMVIQKPGDINGTGEIAVTYEVTGTVASAGVIMRGSDGSILFGSEAEDGTVTPETVTLPWTSESYAYIGEENVFYALSAENAERQEKKSGTITTYSEDHLLDAAADFTTEVSEGDYVYNEADDIFALISSVNSATDCTLNRVLFDESWRTYYIYQKGSYVAAGTTTATESGGLIDDTANFLNKVEIDDDVANNSTGAASTVSSMPEGDGTELELNEDIFTDPSFGEYYLITRDEKKAELEGTSTSGGSFSLIDNDPGTDFVAADVFSGCAVENTEGSGGTFAQVVSVSEHELELDKNIFPSGGDDYRVYTIKSSPAYSSTQETNKLINSSASYLSGVKKGDVVYNPAKDIYGKVTSVDSNTRLNLDSNVFPTISIPYRVYAPRTLTVTVYVNGEAYETFTSDHWDEAEASVSGVIDTTDF